MNLQVYLLYFITFLDLFAVGLVVPLINVHVTNLGGSQFVIGLMGSFYAGLQLFSGPIIGSLSDVKGRKPILAGTLLFCSVCYLSLGFTSSLYVLLLLRLILGMFKHTQTLSKALVTDITKKSSHSEIYGKMAAISGAGITMGPLLGGHILEDYPERGFSIVCSITSLLFILIIGLVCLINSDPINEKKKKEIKYSNGNYIKMAKDSWTKSINELKNVDWIKYWDAFLLKGIVGFSMSIFYSIYSPLLRTHYNLSPKWIGYTMSFQGVIGSLCSYFINYINRMFYSEDREYIKRNIHSFMLLTLTFTGLVLCESWFIFVILLIPLATGNAILRLVTLEIIIQKCPENQRGSLIGASNSMRSISGIIGPFVAGVISDLLNIRYVLVVSLISAAIGTFIATKQKSSKKEEFIKSKTS